MKVASRNAVAIYEERYRIINGERDQHWPCCVYCGDPADTRDHVPPISRVPDYESLGMAIQIYMKVPACRECNTLAGATLQPSFMDRAEYIKDRLARKYARDICIPEWDEEEIKPLGKNLKSSVKKAMAKRKPLVERIEYYAGVDKVLSQLVEIYGHMVEEA